MMTIDETREFLTPIFATDGRRLTPEVVSLWHSLLIEQATLKDAITVAKQWLKSNDGLLKPSNVNQGILNLRRKRTPSRDVIEQAVYAHKIPAELDMPPFRQKLIKLLGDGQNVEDAVENALTQVKQLASQQSTQTTTVESHSGHSRRAIGAGNMFTTVNQKLKNSKNASRND